MEAKHKTREEWLLAAVELFKPRFERNNAPLPPVHVSTGWPSGRACSKNRALGECWDVEASSDGVHQIFISPWMTDVMDAQAKDDAQGVLPTLAHELVHAAIGVQEKHGSKFKKLAKVLGLEGPATATHAGEEMLEYLATFAEELGVFPHAKLEPTKSGKKKQKTHMVKCECLNEDCGYILRTTKKWIEKGVPKCPVGHGQMHVEMPEDDED